jgi:hypothetical protein
MTTILFLLVFIAIAALAPWLGSDSRNLTSTGHPDYYPALPSDTPAHASQLR